MISQDLKYMKSHEWVKQVPNIDTISSSDYAQLSADEVRLSAMEGDIATIGISDYAQSEIQDIVYVELPEVGTELTQKTEFGVIESVKAAFDLYAPVSGEVIEVNESLLDAPEQVNASPYDEGWFLRIRMTDANELDALLDADGYQAHIEAEHA